MELETKSRKELQILARQHGIDGQKLTHSQLVEVLKRAIHGIPMPMPIGGGQAKPELLKREKQADKEYKYVGNKRQLIVQMFLDGSTRSEIAKDLCTPYSYVHTVIKEYAAKEGIEVPRALPKVSKAEQIRQLTQQGYNAGEICNILGVDYSQVHKALNGRK